MKRIACQTCGAGFRHDDSKRGQPPKHCRKHRKARGKQADPIGNRARALARKRAKSKAAIAADVGLELHQAAQLAAGLAVFGEATSAAKYVGLDLTPPKLAELEQLARTRHGDVAEGDLRALGRRLLAAMHLCVESAIRQRDMIHPRDLPHVLRAFAQTHVMTIGHSKHATYANMELVVVGADGQTFNPNAVPQTP